MSNNSKKIVTLKQSGGYRMLPSALHEDVVLRIGSKIDASTKAPLMGLTNNEQDYILTKVIRTTSSNKDLDWYEKVKRFYSDLTILVPFEGLDLNIATRKNIVKINDKEVEVDYPVSELDYIMYKQCLADPTVATTEDEIREKAMYKAYLVNKHVEKEKQLKIQDDLNSLDVYYIRLIAKTEKGDFKDSPKVDAVLRLLGENPQRFDDDREKIFKLSEYRDASKKLVTDGVELKETKFYQVLEDKNLSHKSTIMLYVEKGIIKQEGTYYRYTSSDGKEDIILGNGIDEIVNFMQNPVNSKIVTDMSFKNNGKLVNKLEPSVV